MNNTYLLKIECSESKSARVSQILGTGKFDTSSGTWVLQITELSTDPPIDFISCFLDILEGNYEELSDVGVQQSDISVWRLYEYNEQCNIEITPRDMKRLGSSGIAFCISCWQAEKC